MYHGNPLYPEPNGKKLTRKTFHSAGKLKKARPLKTGFRGLALIKKMDCRVVSGINALLHP